MTAARTTSPAPGSRAPWRSPLRRRLVLQLTAAVVVTLFLLLLGWWTHAAVRKTVTARLESDLENAAAMTSAALRLWASDQFVQAQTLADRMEVRQVLSPQGVHSALGGGDQPAGLSRIVEESGRSTAYVFDDTGSLRMTISRSESQPHAADTVRRALGPVYDGRSVLVRSAAILDFTWSTEGARLVMLGVPVRSDGGEIMGALVVPVDLAGRSSQILRAVTLDGEVSAYVFDATGALLSRPPDNEELRRLNLTLSREESGFVLRDPGGDLAGGHRPEAARSQWPLTRMAQAATGAADGSDVSGYRDYRGVEVVGAWRWIDELGLGVGVETPLVAAFGTTVPVQRAFGVLYALVVATSGATLLGYAWNRRLKLAIEGLRQLGQYQLVAKLGEGGMGAVYLARHAMMRRPCALKILKPSALSRKSVLRFEQEVQITSELSSPNVIQIYDYGRDEADVFYYVMEYVPGITLEQLVEIEKEVNPARTVYILREVCAALAEAHSAGLVHRDIKPLNIMICRQGSRCDVVKVLDFGLVRDEAATPGEEALCGTPIYIPPERLSDPAIANAAVDIYAVGVVGFRLLSGRHPFDSFSFSELRELMLNNPAPSVNQLAKQQVPAQLEQLIASCLERDPALRPASVVELYQRLAAIGAMWPWTPVDAAGWWDVHQKLPPAPPQSLAGDPVAFRPQRY